MPRKRLPLALAAVLLAAGLLALLNRPTRIPPPENDPRPIQTSGVLPKWQAPELEKLLGSRGEHIWGAVTCLVFDRKGRTLVSGGTDGVLRRWDLANQSLIKHYEDHQAPIQVAALSADGSWLLSGDSGGALKVRNVRSHEVWTADGAHPGGVRAAVFVPGDLGGPRFASAGLDGTIKLWDATGRKGDGMLAPTVERQVPAADLKGKGVLALASVEDGRRLASSGQDGNVRLWDRHLSKHEVLEKRLGPVDFLGVGRKGELIVGGAPEKPAPAKTALPKYQVRLWAFAERWGLRYDRFLDCSLNTLPVAVSPDGHTLALGGRAEPPDKFLDFRDGKRSSPGTSSRLFTVAFAPEGKVAFGLDGVVEVRDLAEGGRPAEKPGLILGRPSSARTAVAFTSDGKAVCCVVSYPPVLGQGGGSEIQRWDLATGTASPIVSSQVEVQRLALAPNASRVAMFTADKGYQIKIRRPEQRVEERALKPPPAFVVDMGFSPDGEVLAEATSDSVRLWTEGTGAARHHKVPQGTTIMSVAFFPARHALALACSDGHVRSWDWERDLKTQLTQTPCLGRVALSKRVLAVHDLVGKLNLWDIDGESLKKQRILTGLFAHPRSVRFSRDGSKLAASTDGIKPPWGMPDSGNLAIWDPATGKELHRWSFPGGVWDVAFSPDGTRLATANSDGTVYILRLDSAAQAR
jgi:WD40 repeat protein